MRRIFSTEGAPPDRAFRLWREAVTDRFVPAEFAALGSRPFSGTIEAARVGDAALTRTTTDSVLCEVDGAVARRLMGDKLTVSILLAGSQVRSQNGREAVLGAGDFAVSDCGSFAGTSGDGTRALVVEVPRKRFEDALGPARLYAALAVDGALGGASLAVDFMRRLVEVAPGLDEATGARMASIGQDLLIAAMAERLARATPAPLLAEVAVQRAKAHIASRFGDPQLDPARVAGASGVSLRRLQELFSDRGLGIADLIWERRLAAAAAKLGDPASPDRSIGGVAFSCGFVNQSHFATRFKARFGLSPRDFRVRASRDDGHAPR